jgi:hypothetical protein
MSREGDSRWLALPVAVLLGFIVVAGTFVLCVERLAHFQVPLATPEITTVLLTASSLELVLLTVFFAVFAILGWGEIKGMIAVRVTEVLREREAEADGRVKGVTGLNLCLTSVDENEEVVRRDLLSMGISMTQTAHEKFTESGKASLVRRAANNMAYFSSLRYRSELKTQTESLEDLRLALDYADILWKQYKEERNPEFLLTCARVYLLGAAQSQTAGTPAAWKGKAQEAIRLLGREDIPLSARQRSVLQAYEREYQTLR